VVSIYKGFDCSASYRYGYPDFTYLSRVRSELAAKGIGLASTSSAVVTESVSAKTTTTSSPFSTSEPARTATHVSRRSVASGRECDAASVANRSAHHNSSYNQSSGDSDRHPAPRGKGVSSASTPGTASSYGIDRTSTSRHELYSSARTSSTVDRSDARPQHAVSTVDRSYSGSSYSSSHSNSPGNRHTTRSSRRDGHDSVHTNHSSPAAAGQQSTIYRTVVYDTYRRR